MISNVSVVIVAWNVREHLAACLQAMLKERPLEIFVIDNNSADGSASMVREKFPQVKLIAWAINKGFATACNEGIKQASGDIILLLNPDTTVYPGGLIKASDFFNQHSNVQILGGQLIGINGDTQPSVRRFPSLISQAAIITKIRYIFPMLVNRYLWKHFDYTLSAQVEQVSGALFFIRRAVVEKIGNLDENFFIWFEEVDYCRRVVASGGEVWYSPTIKAQNIGGASFSQLTHLKRQSMFNKSLLYFFRKHHSLGAYLVLLILSPISLLEAILIDIFKSNGSN